MFLGSLATIIFIAYVKGVPLVIKQLINMLDKEPYLASYAEVVGIGGLPLIISLICKDDFRMYDLTRVNLRKSLMLSVPLALTILILRILHEGITFKSFNLQFPYNIWYAILSILAYGPLEVFFIVWLIINTDYVLNSLRKILSPGLLITVLIFGLSHIILSPQGGIINAIKVTIIFLIAKFNIQIQ